MSDQMTKPTPTKYKCPDCGWTKVEGSKYSLHSSRIARRRRIRCGGCGSLNLERQLPDGTWWKADRADDRKICRDCGTKYIEAPCPECGGDELFDPETDDPDWFKK